MRGAARRTLGRVAPGSSAYRRHALVSSLTSISLYATTLVTAPILARALGPEGRGDVAAVMAPAAMLSWLLAMGLPMAAAYHVDNISERTVLATATSFGVVVGVPVCAVLWLLAPTYLSAHSPVTVTWARVFLLIAPLGVGTSAALEVRRRMNPGVSWNLWRSSVLVVPAAGIVALAIAGRLTLQTALAMYFIGTVPPMWLLLSRLWQRPLARPSMSALRVMLPYAWRTASTATATSVTRRFDQVLLVAVVQPEQLGQYAVAVAVASITNLLTSGLALALFGHLRGEASSQRALARYRRSIWMTFVMSSTVALGLALVAPLVLQVVFGADFGPAATALRLLLPGAVAYDVLVVIGTKLYSDGRPGEAARAALLGAVLTVVGLFVLVPHFGIEGAAAVTSLAFLAEVAFLAARGALGGKDPVHREPTAS